MKAKPYRIERIDQILALSAPTRQEIVDALEATGPASVAEIGARLGRAPDSLYHHLRVLARVELVVEVEKRGSGGGSKAIYNLPGRPMYIAYNLDDDDIAGGIAEVVASMLRITEREFRAALRSENVVCDGPRRNIRGTRMKGRLDNEQIKDINFHIEAIRKIFSSPKGRGGGSRVHSMTLVLAPSQFPTNDGS